ncbi:MAG: phosphate-starvation-inducible PsiE family protein [Deltaproteobacteria bacterium]|nr:phosphate-starvation-inducible PsiE family protein [Deltaproteobacteria bacterium]
MIDATKSATEQPQHPAAQHVHQTVVPMLEAADAVVYAMVGVVFFVAALGMLGYSVIAFPANLRDTGFGLAIVKLVNDLLLVMIIMEVLRTVLSYLQERGSSLQPFLFIAAISATRRILAIGAQMSVTGENITPDKFQKAMLDLGANAGAILAIAAALYLLRRPPSQDSDKKFN